MNMQSKLKFLVLSMALATAMMLPMNSNAQGNSDDFFKEEDWASQRSLNLVIGGGGLSPQGIGEPAPLGSGLLVLSLAGAGYAATRRRRSIRKGMAVLLAFAMMIGFTQCKKNLDVLSGADTGKVHITLRVNDDSRVIVDTTNAATNGYAAVSFENGDKMYVGYNKNYVGYLTYSNGNFSGDIDITETVADEPLYFYFLGGKGFEPTFNGNVATLDISDQVLKYPVINYAHSVEVYPSATGDYSARLLNKCAIVKFHVTKPAGYDQAGTCITGMNNLVTVNFDHTATGTDEGFSYSQVNGGAITLPTKNGDVWAILLPQEELSEGEDMSVFSGRHKGIRPAINAIAANDYISTPYELNLNTEFAPVGTLGDKTKLFKVSDDKYVLFSKANLKATTTDGWNTWTWSFKDTQYEYETAGEVGDNYANRTEVGLFGWATSGYNLRGAESSNYFYKPNSTGYGSSGSYGPSSLGYENITGAYAKGDWGYNRITNNAYYQWRVLTKDEWEYLKANHTIGWVKIKGSGSTRWFGHAILPYGSTETLNSEYTIAQWEAMEANGAVLLPISGCRVKSGTNYTNISRVDTYGYYWSSTLYNNSGQSWYISNYWYRSTLDATDYQSRAYGCSVRLVCE